MLWLLCLCICLAIFWKCLAKALPLHCNYRTLYSWYFHIKLLVEHRNKHFLRQSKLMSNHYDNLVQARWFMPSLPSFNTAFSTTIKGLLQLVKPGQHVYKWRTLWYTAASQRAFGLNPNSACLHHYRGSYTTCKPNWACHSFEALALLLMTGLQNLLDWCQFPPL